MENQKNINPKTVNKYNDAIQELLNKNRVGPNADYTHISMGEYFKGKFFLNKKQIKIFNELYAEAINYGCTYSIAEKQKEYGPLIIDIDIEIPSENYTNDTRLYNNEMIFNIIDTYRGVINNYLDVEPGELYASLFEKKEPTNKEPIIKDGFHIMFQGLVVHSKLRHLIRHDVVNLLKNCELYKGFIKPIDDIIDKAVVSSNCWLLLGSRKEKGGIYQLTTIYDDLNNFIDIKKTLEDKNKLLKLYSLNTKYRSEDYETKFNDNITMEFINNEYNKYNEYKPNEYKPNENKPNENNNNDFNFIDGKTKKDFIIKLVDILDNDRSDDWRKWRDIGFIIKGELGANGFDIFNDFSKRSDKYNLKKVRDFFDSIKDIDNKLTLKSLLSVAKKDNNDEYKIIYKEFIKPIEKENKKNKNDIVNIDDINLSNNEITKKNYLKIKIEFEKTHFKIINPLLYITNGLNDDLIINSKKNFCDTYENLLYLKWNDWHQVFINSSFVEDWLKDPDMRTYYKMDFLPGEIAPDNVYNSFTGFEAENKKLFNIDINESLLMKHIKNIFVEDACIEFHLNQMASMLQYPTKPTQVCQLLKSKQGVGKDTLYDFYGNNIFGSKYYINTDNPNLLFGKFNTEIENKILVVLNEAQGADTFKIDNIIKMAITRNTIDIEHKGCKPYKVKSCANYVGLSQHTTSFKIEETDRRFTAQECNNKIIGNVKYFDELHAEIKSGKLDKAFYNFLMNRDIKHITNLQSIRPLTKLYKTMKEYNIPLLTKFLIEIVEKYINATEKSFKSSDLFNDFNAYITAGNFEFKKDITRFGMEMKEYDGIIYEKKRDGRYYTINIQKLKTYFIDNKLYTEEFIEN